MSGLGSRLFSGAISGRFFEGHSSGLPTQAIPFSRFVSRAEGEIDVTVGHALDPGSLVFGLQQRHAGTDERAKRRAQLDGRGSMTAMGGSGAADV